MNKQDMLKVQTCVLRVNIHCDGCKDKVKKKLQKVQGVYKVNIDVEQGKVMVSGNVDPAILIDKLEKSGKHAELWGTTQNRQNPTNFVNNFRIENPNNGGKDNRSQKGNKDQPKSVHQQNPLQQKIQQQQIQQQHKGLKDMKFLGKDHNKSGKLNLSEDEEEEDDEFDSDSDEEYSTGHQVSNKVANGVGGGGHLKDKKGAKNGKKGGGGFDAFLKSMLGKTGVKDGSGKKGGNVKAEKKGNQDQLVGKKGGKNGGFVIGDGKSIAKNGKNDGKNNDSWIKNGGKKFDGVPKMDNKQQGFKEFNANHKGVNGGNMGMMMGNYPMGHFPAAAQGLQMGNFPAASQGLPPADHFGSGHGNPYNQQQYMAQMMMMNQQRANGHDMYHPMMFNRPVHPGMNYGPPPPANDKFTHIFSDENTDSCSIM